MVVEITVRVGQIHYGPGSAFPPGKVSEDWKRKRGQEELWRAIYHAVYELLGFEVSYVVKSIRYGGGGVVWAKVSAHANSELDNK